MVNRFLEYDEEEMERGGAIYREILRSNYEYTHTSRSSISSIARNEQYRLQEEGSRDRDQRCIRVFITRALVRGQVYPVVARLAA